MKIHQEDPRLTAYVLGELPSDEATEIEYAVAADAVLRLAVKEIERSHSQMGEMLGDGAEILLPRQKSAIMRAAREVVRQGKVIELKSHRKARSVWYWPAAAAAVVGMGIFATNLVLPPKGKGGSKQVSKHTDGQSDRKQGLEISDEGSVMKLPLNAGKRSLALVSRAVREDRKMPAIDDVRIEEILNEFPLQSKASVAVWKGCSLGAEILPCPWKPSASLIFVNIKSATEEERELSVEYRENEETVVSRRVLGYRLDDVGESREIGEAMNPGAEHLLLILVEATGDDLGSLVWNVEGEIAPAVLLERNEEGEQTDDARFAALVCAYGLWLRGEESEFIDDAMLLALAREVASDSLVPDRYDFLELIDQTVKLKD